ncbi:MAG: polyribonucleotide nucleotidyltransferase [Bacteroidetes bacterium]|nr:polyribonucleotide nucleotidyltransferase [Bacteroidota bacterium]
MIKPEVISQTITLPDGRNVIIETGKLAKMANGAVTVRLDDTILLATVVANKVPKPGVDFMPLTVDYQESFASTGRFPGGFFKRERNLSEYEVLICRLVDRALRPLFPDDFHCDTQIMISLISSDQKNIPDCLAGLAASAALSISDIPFGGPISEVRVAKVDGALSVNPTFEMQEKATLDIIVSGSIHDINMVEGEMKECSEAEMLEAIKLAHEVIKTQCQAQLDLVAKCGKPKFAFDPEPENEEIKNKITELFAKSIFDIAMSGVGKSERSEAFEALIKGYMEALPEDTSDEDKALAKKYFSKLKKSEVRRMILDERRRLDGRKMDEVRGIWCEVDVLPTVHGSALFQRGETQALATVTLGTKLDEQIIDSAIHQGTNRFLLHYNFPGFSTGEVKPKRAPARREVGHANLAMRAIKPVLPDAEVNPYTVRVVSDVLESNGSSSMATVCAGTLALLDAGVKLLKPVSGIAMGLISGENGKYAILSDILGDEDHLGDMDFKVTGTADGITACQMDLKVDGLSYQVLEEALEQAKQGRLHILGIMNSVQPAAREDYKPFVPRLEKLIIDKEFIGAVIGSGGKVIQGIQRETGATISIEEVDGKGIIEISSPDKESIDKAMAWIIGIVTPPEVGKTYEGKVVSLQAFGAFVEFLPGKEGLLHISEISYQRIDSMEGVLNPGDIVQVKLLEIDERSGKFRLSMKALLPVPEGYVEPVRRERESSGGGYDRDRRGGGGDRRGGGGGDRGGRGRY